MPRRRRGPAADRGPRTSRGSACRRARAAPRSAAARSRAVEPLLGAVAELHAHVADHVVVAGEEAALAEDLQAPIRRALDHVVPEVDELGAQAAGELELDGHVVLDAGMAGAVLLPGAQARDRAEEPGQQIEVVHAVLDQRSAGGEAAVLAPGGVVHAADREAPGRRGTPPPSARRPRPSAAGRA